MSHRASIRAQSRLGVAAAVVAATASSAGLRGGASPRPSVPGEACEQAKLTAEDAQVFDAFGGSLSISGDTLVIGAAHDDDSAGSAYVFTRRSDTWTQTQKLIAADREVWDGFGFSVGISGDTVIIGANEDDDRGALSGSAYVFEREGDAWTEVAKLTADDGTAGDEFGFAVSICGDTALVGAYGDDTSTGSAYLLERVDGTWRQTGKLTASDGLGKAEFGTAVCLDRDTAVIGAWADDEQAHRAGAAYVFARDGVTWVQTAKLIADDGDVLDAFGFAVSVHDATIVVGAFWDDDRGEDSGSAYVFEKAGGAWHKTAKLTAIDGKAGDGFGWAVSVEGDIIVIGAPAADDHGNLSGSTYVFKRADSTWNLSAKLIPRDATADQTFGGATAVCGDDAVIGAPLDDANGARSGSAYVFDLRNCPCLIDIDGDGAVGFLDLLAILAAWGPYEPCPPRRSEDIDHDCVVGFSDLLLVLAAWGPCK